MEISVCFLYWCVCCRPSGEREARHFSTMDRFQHVKSITGVLSERNSRGTDLTHVYVFVSHFVIILT